MVISYQGHRVFSFIFALGCTKGKANHEIEPATYSSSPKVDRALPTRFLLKHGTYYHIT